MTRDLSQLDVDVFEVVIRSGECNGRINLVQKYSNVDYNHNYSHISTSHTDHLRPGDGYVASYPGRTAWPGYEAIRRPARRAIFGFGRSLYGNP